MDEAMIKYSNCKKEVWEWVNFDKIKEMQGMKHYRPLSVWINMVSPNNMVNPLTSTVPHHTETSQLTCNGNQLTGFYVVVSNGRKWVNLLKW